MIWKKLVRDYFTFNKREKRGAYSLIVLLTLLSGTHLLLRFYPDQHQAYSELELAEFELFAQNIEYAKPIQVMSQVFSDTSLNGEKSIVWRKFDPNLVSLEELVDLGLERWMAKRVINYREKVKPFAEVSDLKKVYDIDTSWVNQASPFVDIDPKFKESTKFKTNDGFKQEQKVDSLKLKKIDLNLADTSELKSIPGIGSFYARQIVELRSRYKGFRSFDQLLDLYRVSDETLTILSEKTTIDTTVIQRIDLNSCLIEDLGRHPCITWKQARIIIAYRDQHENFKSVKEIMRTDVISDSLYLKIAPYLEIK